MGVTALQEWRLFREFQHGHRRRMDVGQQAGLLHCCVVSLDLEGQHHTDPTQTRDCPTKHKPEEQPDKVIEKPD